MTQAITPKRFRLVRYILIVAFATATLATGVTLSAPVVGTWLFLTISVIYYKPGFSMLTRENSLSTSAVAVAVVFLAIQTVMLA